MARPGSEDNLENPNIGLLLTFLSGGGAAWGILAGDPQDKEINTLHDTPGWDAVFESMRQMQAD